MSGTLPKELIRVKAYEFWEERQFEGRDGTPEGDWEEARQYLEKHQWEVRYWKFKKVLNNPISFFWKTLPASDWVKLLGVPVVLGFATAWVTSRYQEENRQIETINKYFEQIEKLVVSKKIDKNIDWSKLDDSVKVIVKAKSLATLRSINLQRKEIIISFLSETDLLNSKNNGISLKHFNLSPNNKFESGIILSGLKLKNINLSNATLLSSNFVGADLAEANLIRSDLSSSNLEQVNLNRALLQDSKLSSTHLYNANLSGVNLVRADLTRAFLKEANLEKADLWSTNFKEANLEGANLKGAKLVYANLEGANLEGANLIEVKNLKPKQIKSACFWEEAIYKGDWYEDKIAGKAKEPDNRNYIEELRNDKTPYHKPNCSRWSK